LITCFGCWPFKLTRALKNDHLQDSGARQKTVYDTCRQKDCLIEVLKAHPDNLDARWLLGQVYEAQQDYVKAIQEFDVVIKQDSSFNLGYALRDRASCKNNMRRDSSAIVDMTAAINFNPTERYFYLQRGIYFNNLQQYELALNDFNKAIDLFAQFDEALEWRSKMITILHDKKKDNKK
jgi:tetratricopeptide (TPR) repeat protein